MQPCLCLFPVPCPSFCYSKVTGRVYTEEWPADLITGCPCHWHGGETDTHAHNPHCSCTVTIHLDSGSTHTGTETGLFIKPGDILCTKHTCLCTIKTQSKSCSVWALHTHTHLTEGVIEHWNAWGDIKPQQRCVLFMLNWLVRDEVLNQKNEVERHREREGYRASECITRLLKDDVSDRAQLCCEDLVLVGFCELRECENLCSLTRVSMNVKKKKTRGKKRKVY